MVIGITTLIFGMFQLKRLIVEPHEVEGNAKFKTAEELEEERTEMLKNKDTDSDGLSDYDELYLFRTSPFLADSDSDGINDGDEVAESTDPNCPVGRTCRVTGDEDPEQPAPSTTPSGESDLPPDLTPDEEQIMTAMDRVFGDMEELTPETMSARLNELTPEELRTFMRDIGVPEEMLEKTDDETLKKILSETMGAVNNEGENDAEELEEMPNNQ